MVNGDVVFRKKSDIPCIPPFTIHKICAQLKSLCRSYAEIILAAVMSQHVPAAHVVPGLSVSLLPAWARRSRMGLWINFALSLPLWMSDSTLISLMTYGCYCCLRWGVYILTFTPKSVDMLQIIGLPPLGLISTDRLWLLCLLKYSSGINQSCAAFYCWWRAEVINGTSGSLWRDIDKSWNPMGLGQMES